MLLMSSKKVYLNIEFFKFYPGKLIELEIFPHRAKDGFGIDLGLTLLCVNIIFIEFWRFTNEK